MVDGPSIIFHRYHEKGKTKVRQAEMEAVGRDPKPCQGVVGYDANALYLWSIMQEMPTGHYDRRRAETGFRKEYKHTSEEAQEWMECLNLSRGLQLQHEANGSEKRVGRSGFARGRLRSGAWHGVSVPRVLLAWLSYVFSRGYDPSYEEQDHGRIAPDDRGYLDLRPKSVRRGTSGGDVGMSVGGHETKPPRDP